jgi:hypothetical protein
VTSDYELLLVITLSEIRFITRISSEPVPYSYVPHRLTQFRKVRVFVPDYLHCFLCIESTLLLLFERMASSSAMVPRGPREVTIAPVWEASTEGVSTDIEMVGATNYTFTVPDFVASAVDSIQSQLRYFHAKLEDTTQMSLMTAVQQQELYDMQQRMGMFLKKVWEDCRAEAQSTITFNEQRYEIR